MNHIHAFSSSELLPSPPTSPRPAEDTGLEGLSTHLKLLLKIIQDYNGGCTKDNDERKSHKVAGMISIIDDVRSRIQRVQSSTRRRAELRRCNTDLKPNIPRDKRAADHLIVDEKERLMRELSASLIAQKSIQAICSSLGKEKEIMARELARKGQQLAEMEEFISDLKARNERLLEKLQACHIELKEKEKEKEKKCSNGGETHGNIALQERNKELSEQLQKSLDGYRFLKRRLKETQEENKENEATIEEMEVEIQAGSDRLHGLKDKRIKHEETHINITEEISVLEDMLESLQQKISKLRQKKSE